MNLASEACLLSFPVLHTHSSFRFDPRAIHHLSISPIPRDIRLSEARHAVSLTMRFPPLRQFLLGVRPVPPTSLNPTAASQSAHPRSSSPCSPCSSAPMLLVSWCSGHWHLLLPQASSAELPDACPTRPVALRASFLLSVNANLGIAVIVYICLSLRTLLWAHFWLRCGGALLRLTLTHVGSACEMSE